MWEPAGSHKSLTLRYKTPFRIELYKQSAKYWLSAAALRLNKNNSKGVHL